MFYVMKTVDDVSRELPAIIEKEFQELYAEKTTAEDDVGK